MASASDSSVAKRQPLRCASAGRSCSAAAAGCHGCISSAAALRLASAFRAAGRSRMHCAGYAACICMPVFYLWTSRLRGEEEGERKEKEEEEGGGQEGVSPQQRQA